MICSVGWYVQSIVEITVDLTTFRQNKLTIISGIKYKLLLIYINFNLTA